jgi:hypothetical protein
MRFLFSNKIINLSAIGITINRCTVLQGYTYSGAVVLVAVREGHKTRPFEGDRAHQFVSSAICSERISL